MPELKIFAPAIFSPRCRRVLCQGAFIYISTSGVYGDCGGARVSEVHRLNPQSSRALRRVDAELQIRQWAKRNGVSASILRVPGIYAKDRLPLERLRTGMPAITAAEDGYTNHIHADDLAHIIVAALRCGKPNRVYHASDDGETKMGDYFDAVADAYGLPHPPRITRAEAQRVLPQSLLSFMNESRRLLNERMKRELGRETGLSDGNGVAGYFARLAHAASSSRSCLSSGTRCMNEQSCLWMVMPRRVV